MLAGLRRAGNHSGDDGWARKDMYGGVWAEVGNLPQDTRQWAGRATKVQAHQTEEQMEAATAEEKRRIRGNEAADREAKAAVVRAHQHSQGEQRQ